MAFIVAFSATVVGAFGPARAASPAQPLTRLTTPTGSIYLSVPPHSTAVNPVRAGAGTRFCSGTAS